MIIRQEDLKIICSTILVAVDSNELSQLTETLELKISNKTLWMSVTNREYFVKVKLNLNEQEDLHATVNAQLFLKLISQITTDTIELVVDDTSLIVKGNGVYKLPLIFDGDKLLELPEIPMDNITTTFNVNGDILNNILTYNSKELTKGAISRPVQKLFYVDEKGCITFTNGACVNKFDLPSPVKLLFNNRLVKLFKLFKDETVGFELGHDAINSDLIQTKVRFKSASVEITAILTNDDGLLNSVPVDAIRNRALKIYPHSIVINKNSLIQTINRLALFGSGYGSKETLKPYSTFEFKSDNVVIYDANKENKETIYYDNSESLEEPYTAIIDLSDLKITLDSCVESHVNLSFGDSQAIVISRGNIYNVIPECKEF